MRLPGSKTISFGLVILTIFVSIRTARADDFMLDPDQIKAALHTATDEEGGFVDRSVALVKKGTLPRDIFTTAFIWARKKPKHRFQYFKQALTLRAAQIGITLT
jgi:hypothetical protein